GISGAACVVISHRVDVQKIDPHKDVEVKTPVKAHLNDGSTVVYPDGVKISGGMLRGNGVMDDITLTQHKPVQLISLENVAGIEAFRTKTNTAQSIVFSALASAGGVAAGAALAVAIFGSC